MIVRRADVMNKKTSVRKMMYNVYKPPRRRKILRPSMQKRAHQRFYTRRNLGIIQRKIRMEH